MSECYIIRVTKNKALLILFIYFENKALRRNEAYDSCGTNMNMP